VGGFVVKDGMGSAYVWTQGIKELQGRINTVVLDKTTNLEE